MEVVVAISGSPEAEMISRLAESEHRRRRSSACATVLFIILLQHFNSTLRLKEDKTAPRKYGVCFIKDILIKGYKAMKAGGFWLVLARIFYLSFMFENNKIRKSYIEMIKKYAKLQQMIEYRLRTSPKAYKCLTKT